MLLLKQQVGFGLLTALLTPGQNGFGVEGADQEEKEDYAKYSKKCWCGAICPLHDAYSSYHKTEKVGFMPVQGSLKSEYQRMLND